MRPDGRAPRAARSRATATSSDARPHFCHDLVVDLLTRGALRGVPPAPRTASLGSLRIAGALDPLGRVIPANNIPRPWGTLAVGLIGDVIALARDKREGPSRVLLLRALLRSKDPRARAALLDLRDDPDLTKEIEVILRRLNRTKPAPRSRGTR